MLICKTGMMAHPHLACDVLVIGSGAAGLMAAVAAASCGLNVLVVEKSAYVGGATAWSGGWIWVPGNSTAVDQRAEDVRLARAYLKAEIGAAFEADRVDAYLEAIGPFLHCLKNSTPVRFIPGVTVPDYRSGTTGASTGGRSQVVAPFDGRLLGREIHRLRMPLATLTLAGLMPAAGREMGRFYSAARSFSSALHVAKRFGRHWLDQLRAGRGLHLVNGNALAGGLFHATLNLNVTVKTGVRARRLLLQDGRVSGAELVSEEGTLTAHAKLGVVLACGGFPADAERRAQLFDHDPTGQEHWTAAPPESDGEGLRLGESIGAHVVSPGRNAGAWAPVSLVPRRSGGTLPFPHFSDRAKPGIIAVTRNGRRFTNEAAPYFTFMNGLFGAIPPGMEVAAWLICDHRFQRRYGLGFAKPWPFPLGPYLRSGYLKRDRNLGALAAACGIDAAALCATVSEYNRHAAKGEDPAFGRGSEAINRAQGDPAVRPNPCVAPLDQPPYYAVRIRPGSLGTFAGLATDECARVLDVNGAPIAALYAAGGDMASIMSGAYPAGGISLGPALVFGFIAGRHIAGGTVSTTHPVSIC